MAGALLDYLIENLNFAKDFNNFEKMASKVKKNNIFIHDISVNFSRSLALSLSHSVFYKENILTAIKT